jgi:hypothetical protein
MDIVTYLNTLLTVARGCSGLKGLTIPPVATTAFLAFLRGEWVFKNSDSRELDHR